MILTSKHRIVLPKRWMTRRQALLSLIPVIGQIRRRWIIAQDFEGGGTPHPWVVSGGSPDFDYSTVPLVGTQSLRCGSNTVSCYVPIGNLNEVWMFARFRRESTPSVVDSTEMAFLAGSPGSFTTPCRIAGNTSSRSHRFHVGSLVGAFNLGSAENQDLSVWLHYKKGTGATAVGKVYAASGSEERPASPVISTTTGTSTSNAAYAYLQGAIGGPCVFDKIRVSATEIGSYPL